MRPFFSGASRVLPWFLVVFAVVGAGRIGFASEASGDARKQCRQYLRMVRVQMEEGRADSALVYSDLAKGCDPTHPDPYWYGAHAHLAMDASDLALALLEEGVKQAPMSKRLSLFLARLYVDAGLYDGAQPLLDRVLMIHKGDPEALFLRGRIELASGDSTAALLTWKGALHKAVAGKGDL